MPQICSAEWRVLLYLDHDTVNMSLKFTRLLFACILFLCNIYNCFVGVSNYIQLKTCHKYVVPHCLPLLLRWQLPRGDERAAPTIGLPPPPPRAPPPSGERGSNDSPEANPQWEGQLWLARGKAKMGQAATTLPRPLSGGRHSHDSSEAKPRWDRQ
jgi:hypothetical protein